MKNALLALLLLAIFPIAPFIIMGCYATPEAVDELKKSHAETAAKVANTADALVTTAELVANNTALINKANETLSNLAKVQANIAHELNSAQAHVADKLATIADMNIEITKVHEQKANSNTGKAQSNANAAGQHAANALDLSDVPSGPQVNIGNMVTDAANKAISGDWVGLAGLAITSLIGAGATVHQNRKAKRFKRDADLNAQLADEVADLEPTKAREVLKVKRKQS